MIKTTMIGHIGKDADVRQLQDGTTAIGFSLAHTEKFKKEGEQVEKTTWVKCTIWRKKGDSIKIAAYLKKGGRVYVEGTPSASAWLNDEKEPRASLELRVSRLELLSVPEGAAEPEKENEFEGEMPF